MPGAWYRRDPTVRKTWYERNGGARLAGDRSLVAERYPDLAYRIDDRERTVSLEGSITLRADCGVRTPIAVRIEFPWDYPEREPRAYDAANRFPHDADHHFHPSGRCCLWLAPESRWDPQDPGALASFLDEVAVFFDRQLVYEAQGGGSWPGGQRSHGGLGYVELVEDLLGSDPHALAVLAPVFAGRSRIGRNDRCPCGSGVKYKRCHLPMVEHISRRIPPPDLREAFCRFLDGAAMPEKIRPSA